MGHKNLDYKKIVTLIIYAVAAAGFAYILVTQFGSLKNSFRLILKSDSRDELIALCFILVSYLAAAQSYYFLSFGKLRLSRTVIIEFAVSAINKILPSGIGGLTANYVYLRKHSNSRAQATAAVALNNTLGFLANMGLLAILVIFVKSNPLSFHRPNNRDIIVVASIVLIAVVLLLTEARKWIFKSTKSLIRELRTYRWRRESLIFSFITQISITFAVVIALYLSLSAIHAHLAFSSVMLSYSFAIWLSTILPTPGGIGAVETGLTGAFVAFGLKFDTALSAVLIFRLLSFWVPFFLGGLFLIWARKHRYV